MAVARQLQMWQKVSHLASIFCVDSEVGGHLHWGDDSLGNVDKGAIRENC